MLKELAAAVLFGASRRGRGREARQGLQPGDVRSSLRRAAAGEGAEAHDFQPGDVRSSLRRAAAGGGAEAHDLQPGEVLVACRRRRRRGGLQLYQLRAAWGATGQLSGIWLGLWVSASGGAKQSASMSICGKGALMKLFM